nr:prenyl-dependent CAAX protease, putative [Ipomoea batatas]
MAATSSAGSVWTELGNGGLLSGSNGRQRLLPPFLVLTSLEPLDYIVVSFLPRVSEEFLFRGALLPLFGANWPSALAVAAVFGILHLGSGRKYSFAIWNLATFVGLAYGYATISTSSIIVPMAAHALNNLIGVLSKPPTCFQTTSLSSSLNLQMMLQVLTSLEPLDYIVVSFLPRVSEVLCPLPVAVFGILHLGSGRKYSFAIWNLC